MIFLVVDQQFASIRNAQRYLATLVRTGFTRDQIRLVVNRYQKKVNPSLASLEQIKSTLNQPVFYGIPESPAFLAAVNKGRPLVSDRLSFPEADKSLRAFVDKATKPAPIAAVA
jgi:pilus assembly protein CpaE